MRYLRLEEPHGPLHQRDDGGRLAVQLERPGLELVEREEVVEDVQRGLEDKKGMQYEY